MKKRLLALGGAALALACMVASGPALAYKLYTPTACPSGVKWDTSRPIQVRLANDSITDYVTNRTGGLGAFGDFLLLDQDVRSVIARYNEIPGSSVVLEMGEGVDAGVDLGEPDDENWGTQTIVIGFTDRTSKNPSAEAWGPGVSDVKPCTRTRAHILFRKDVNWVFGPPDDTDVDGRHFSTVKQPRVSNDSQPHTFLGILTHEMGHALGLNHPIDDYAIMAQSFNTWFRGPDHVLRTELLPDDIAGILALYGETEARTHLDVSVTNSWVKTSAQRTNCRAEAAVIASLEADVAEVEAVLPYLQGAGREAALANIDRLKAEISEAEDALEACEDSNNAAQVENCFASSRGDGWADKLDERALCGTNERNSSYAPVSDRICPGDQVQVRYTLNNHSMFRDALVKAQMWLSPDTELNVIGGARGELKSRDEREFTIQPGKSALIGQVFRMPENAVDGQIYRVFIRAMPYDSVTGQSLWRSDARPWNNAIMLRSVITVSSADCS